MSESFTIQVADSLRRFEPNSPRSSPRGNRSPVVPRQQDSTGTLKTTISLGKTPTIVHTGPFYLHKELPGICAKDSVLSIWLDIALLQEMLTSPEQQTWWLTIIWNILTTNLVGKNSRIHYHPSCLVYLAWLIHLAILITLLWDPLSKSLQLVGRTWLF